MITIREVEQGRHGLKHVDHKAPALAVSAVVGAVVNGEPRKPAQGIHLQLKALNKTLEYNTIAEKEILKLHLVG